MQQNNLATKDDLRVLREEFHDDMHGLKNDVFDRLDDISAKLETIQEDQTLKFHQDREVKEKVEDQEKRITSLELQKN